MRKLHRHGFLFRACYAKTRTRQYHPQLALDPRTAPILVPRPTNPRRHPPYIILRPFHIPLGVAQHLAPSRAPNNLPIRIFLPDQELLVDSPRAELELSLAVGRGTVVALPCDEGAASAAEVPVVAGDDLVVGVGGGGGRGPGEGRDAQVEEVHGEGAGLLAALGA